MPEVSPTHETGSTQLNWRQAVAGFQVTLLSSLGALRLRLRDEKQRKLVGFGQLKTRPVNEDV